MWNKIRYISIILCIMFMITFSNLRIVAQVPPLNLSHTTESVYRSSFRYRRQLSTRKTVMVMSIILCAVAEGVLYWRYRSMKKQQNYLYDHKLDKHSKVVYTRVKEIFYAMQDMARNETLNSTSIHFLTTHAFYNKLNNSRFAYIYSLRNSDITCIKPMEDEIDDHKIMVCISMEEYEHNEWKVNRKDYWELCYQGDVLMLNGIEKENCFSQKEACEATN